jgi:tetratricopeptide (TPR) repeat protein
MSRPDDYAKLATPDALRIEDRCKLSQMFEHARNLKDATSILGSYWKGAGKKPDLNGLPMPLAADVLLRIGVLTGLLDGDVGVPANDTQTAESIINEALSLYVHLDLTSKVAEARAELAVCYWRKRRHDDARTLLLSALDLIKHDGELKAQTVLRLAGVEVGAGQASAGLTLLESSQNLFKSIDDLGLTGGYYTNVVAALLLLAELESNQTSQAFEAHIDRIFIQCAVAKSFFERTESKSGIGMITNNLAYAYFFKRHYVEALEHLDEAYEIFVSLGQRSMLAHVDEMRARVFLAQDNPRDAELYALSSVTAMEEGGEQWNLPTALITRGRALARLDRVIEAIACFGRALKCAEQAGNLEAVKQAEAARLQETGRRKADDKFPYEDAPCQTKVLPFRSKRMPLNPIIITVPDNTLVSKDIQKGDKLELSPVQEFKDGDVALVESSDGRLLALAYHEGDAAIRLEWSYGIIEPRRYKKGRYKILGVLLSVK